MSQLAALHAERDTIDQALKIGGSRAHQKEVERATEIWAAHFDQIAAIERRRVTLALQLQRLTAKRERLRETIMKAGGAGYLSTDSVDLLGLGEVEEEVAWAVERVIADKICTRAEIERTKMVDATLDILRNDLVAKRINGVPGGNRYKWSARDKILFREYIFDADPNDIVGATPAHHKSATLDLASIRKGSDGCRCRDIYQIN